MQLPKGVLVLEVPAEGEDGGGVRSWLVTWLESHHGDERDIDVLREEFGQEFSGTGQIVEHYIYGRSGISNISRHWGDYYEIIDGRISDDPIHLEF